MCRRKRASLVVHEILISQDTMVESIPLQEIVTGERNERAEETKRVTIEEEEKPKIPSDSCKF